MFFCDGVKPYQIFLSVYCWRIAEGLECCRTGKQCLLLLAVVYFHRRQILDFFAGFCACKCAAL